MPKFQKITEDLPDTQTELAVRSHERDEDQRAMDALVKPLVEAWKAAGEPSTHTKAMTDRVRVAKGERTDVTKMVRRAMNLHGADPSWYQPTKPDANGSVIIKFGPQKRKVTAAKTDTPAAPAAPEPKPEPEHKPEPEPEHRRGVLPGRR